MIFGRVIERCFTHNKRNLLNMKDDVDDDESGTTSTGTSTDATIPYGSARASRNLAEKQRRDNLNANITMMAAMVPSITGSSRRQDKISILRLAGAFLRSFFTIGSGTPGFLPFEYSDIDLEENFIDSFDANGGFLIVVTTTGNIVYISRRVEAPLGHLPSEMMGKSLYSYVHPDDHEELTKALTPDESFPAIMNVTDATHTDQNSNSSDDSTNNSPNEKPFQEQRRSFNIKIAQRTNSRGEHTQFKCIHVSGVLRLADFCRKKGNKARNSTSNDIIFVGIARLMQRRITELSLFEANKQEYVTRHLVDGRIIFSDHRIAIVAGYMTEEVSGVNAFSFMHKDDVRYTVMALRQMYDRREGFGSSCYRLLSKTGAFIYLRTHGYLEFDQKTREFESFVCINTLVEKEEGEKLIRDLKERFSATISPPMSPMIENDSSYSQLNSTASVEDPTRLEDVISHLISDIASPTTSDDQDQPSPVPDIQYAKAAIYSQKMPPVSVQAKRIGVKNIKLSDKGKSKRIKLEPTNSPSYSQSQLHSPDPQEALGNCSQIITSGNQNVMMNFISNDVMTDVYVKDNPLSNKSTEIITETINMQESLPTESSHSNVSRGKNMYENMPDTNSILMDESQCVSNGLNSVEYNNDNEHCRKPDTMLMFIKNEIIDNDEEHRANNRSYDEDDCDTLQKRQRLETFDNDSKTDSSTFQDIMKANPDFLKMLDELGQVINSEKNGIDPDVQKFATDQVDQTLRQTYSHLEDRINCQENQINELELVLESPDLQAQRGNFDQIQAEHEVQKKIMKNLQQKHYNMKANLKQNVGV